MSAILFDGRTLELPSGSLALSPRQAAIVTLLIDRAGVAVPHHDFFSAIWPGEAHDKLLRRLQVETSKLHDATRDLGAPGAISTAHGYGYAWTAPIARGSVTAGAPASHRTEPHGGAAGFAAAIARSADAQHSPALPDDDRGPMEPGNAVTWGAITAGTVLAGERYQYEPPLGRQAAHV